MQNPSFVRLLALISVATVALMGRSEAQTRLAPFVATPPDVVERMLTLGQVGPRDVVYDLGSGDGRIVIAAAARGARAVGVDIDPSLVERSQAAAAAAGLSDRAEFRVQDATTVDLRDATVVTLYLLAASNVRLRPMLAALRPGARVIAHNFPIGDWEPDMVETFTDANGATRTIFLWKIR